MKEDYENNSDDDDDEEMLDIADQVNFQSSEDNITMKSVSVKSRGRPKIPIQWSRLIMMDYDDEEDIETYLVDQDMQEAKQ